MNETDFLLRENARLKVLVDDLLNERDAHLSRIERVMEVVSGWEYHLDRFKKGMYGSSSRDMYAGTEFNIAQMRKALDLQEAPA